MVHNKSICFITPHSILYSMGGVEIQTYYLAKEFKRREWDVEFIIPNNGKVLYPEYIIEGVKYLNYSRGNILKSFFSVLRILFFRSKAFYYYQRGVSSFILGALYIFTSLSGRKRIWALCNDNEAVDITFGNSLKNSRNILKYLVQKPLSLLNIYGKKKSHLILCQTVIQKNNLKNRCNLESAIVRNSHPIHHNNTQNKKIILWAGPLVEHKNPLPFLRLIQDPDVNCLEKSPLSFVIVSRMVTSTDNFLKKKVQNVVSNPNVLFYESLSIEKMIELFCKTVIYINTSNYEGFPNNMIQAWLNGALVISLKLDPDNVIKNNGIGLVVDSYNELKQAVLHFLNYEHERIEITNKARNFGLKMFDIQKNVSMIEKHLLNL